MPSWTPAPYALPYITGQDVLEQTPSTNEAQMRKISQYLEQVALPPGVIQAYVGTDAPDFWLLCDGSSYDPDKLPELSGVNDDFHEDGVFRVPDMRGRSPIGTADFWGDPNIYPEAEVVRDIELGQRTGDHRTGAHTHSVKASVSESRWVYAAGSSFGPLHGWVTGHYSGGGTEGASGEPLEADTQSGSSPQFCAYGSGHNYQPSTGVNFIIYAARPTKNVDLGKGTPITRVTARDMVEAQLADPNITEEERSMLEEQLASLS